MKYQYPPISMLKSVSNSITIEESRLTEMAEEIVKVMSMWKVSSKVVDFRVTPMSDVVTSSIKANLPCRASFTVVDSRESNAIINKAGFQRLCGAGDMLFSLNVSSETEHVQAAYVSEDEIKSVVQFMKQYS